MLKESDLDQFTGNLERWRHSLCRNLLFTPGVKYLCEHGCKKKGNTAWWLLEAVASYQRDKRINEYLCSLQFWILTVNLKANSAFLKMTNGHNEDPIITQRIPLTDFCLPKIRIWVGNNGYGTRTAFLPSEY